MYIFSNSDKCRKYSCMFKTLVSLWSKTKNPNHPLPRVYCFKNIIKVIICNKFKEFPPKMRPEHCERDFFYNFCSRLQGFPM